MELNDFKALMKADTTGRMSKIEGTPEHARLVNSDINGMPVPDWLDRDWYISLAKKRVSGFKGE